MLKNSDSAEDVWCTLFKTALGSDTSRYSSLCTDYNAEYLFVIEPSWVGKSGCSQGKLRIFGGTVTGVYVEIKLGCHEAS